MSAKRVAEKTLKLLERTFGWSPARADVDAHDRGSDPYASGTSLSNPPATDPKMVEGFDANGYFLVQGVAGHTRSFAGVTDYTGSPLSIDAAGNVFYSTYESVYEFSASSGQSQVIVTGSDVHSLVPSISAPHRLLYTPAILYNTSIKMIAY